MAQRNGQSRYLNWDVIGLLEKVSESEGLGEKGHNAAIRSLYRCWEELPKIKAKLANYQRHYPEPYCDNKGKLIPEILENNEVA